MCVWELRRPLDASASGNSRGVGAPARKERQVFLLFRLQVMEGHAGEVRDDDITRGILGAAIVEKVLEVLKSLRLGPCRGPARSSCARPAAWLSRTGQCGHIGRRCA